MTMVDDVGSDRRIARKNAVRKADKAAACPCCGNRSALLRLTALWKAAYVMRDPALEDMAHDLEREITGCAD